MTKSKNKKIIIWFIVSLIALLALVWIIKGLRSEELPGEGFPLEERYILSGRVKSVDPDSGLIISVDPVDGSEITIQIGEETGVYRVVFSEEASGIFQTQRVSIGLDEVRVGQSFFVKSKDSFAGQSQLLNVDYIEFMP